MKGPQARESELRKRDVRARRLKLACGDGFSEEDF